MSTRNNNQVITCGACAVTMNESGEMITSIDLMVKGAKRLFSKTGRRNASSRTTVAAQL